MLPPSLFHRQRTAGVTLFSLVTLALVTLALLQGVSPAGAQLASLVADLNTGPASAESSSPFGFVQLGDRLVFLAADAAVGYEPWATSAGGADTELLADTCAGECGLPSFLGSTGTLAFYESPYNDFTNGLRLWRTDGTRAGTFPLAAPGVELQIRLGESEPPSHAVLGERLYFAACTDALGCELWSTDANGTALELVTDLAPGPEGSDPFHLVATDDALFFLAREDGAHGLLALDGTGEIRSLPGASPLGPPTLLTASGGLLFFVARSEGQELWVSDGTFAGTRPLTDLAASEPFSGTEWLAPTSDGVLFLADDVVHGVELWRSDGTPEGTGRITDFGFATPFNSPSVRQLAEVAAGYLFWATDGLGNSGLWASDGSPASTRRLDQVPPVFARPLVVLDGLALFVVDNSFGGQELWRSDGTLDGTGPLATFCDPACSVQISEPTVLGDEVVFAVFDFASGWRLWSTDGTPAGTALFSTASTPSLVDPLSIARLGDELFLAASSGPSGQELWVVARGASAPILLDLNTGAPSASPESLTVVGDEAYFAACDGAQRVLWRLADGAVTPVSGAPPFVNFCPFGANRELLAATADTLVFVVNTFRGLELWRARGGQATQLFVPDLGDFVAPFLVSDGDEVFFLLEGEVEGDGQGEAEGEIRVELLATDGDEVRLVRSLPPGVTSGRDLASDGEALFFLANDADGNHQLWTSDGTAGGTLLLRSFANGGFFDPLKPVRVGGRTFFVGYTEETGQELWLTDGTPGGTRIVADLFPGPVSSLIADRVAHDGRLHFFARTTDGGVGLWRTDGTSAGTELLRRFRAPENNPFGPWGTSAVSTEQGLIFVFDDGVSGREPWISESGGAVTRRVVDLAPGRASSAPAGLFALGGHVYFEAHDGRTGFELWRTDGTATGTRLVHDIAPGPASSRPQPLGALGETLLLSANDGVLGRELWALEITESGCVAGGRALCLAGDRFRVEASWRDFAGEQGLASTRPLTDDTGAFWFFDDQNLETIVKVLDARGVNGHFWVFYGALSNVEYTLTVTDTVSGTAQRYRNPLGVFASAGDTEAFGPRGARLTAGGSAPALSTSATTVERLARSASREPCVPGAQTLCLAGGRFAVEVAWADFVSGTGTGSRVPLTDDTGGFWFFDPANVELVIKVLDARAVNGRFWVFFGSLSNVELTVTVTDTESGAQRIYRNPLGSFGSFGDTDAF